MPRLFEKNSNGVRKGARQMSGPPMPVVHTATPRGQRVDAKGAEPGKGITPDAKVRQKVLNRNADDRRNNREGMAAPPGAEQSVAGPPTAAPTPLGTPPEATARPRVPADQAAAGAQVAMAPPGAPAQPQAVTARQAMGQPGAPQVPQSVATPVTPPGPERQQFAQSQAQQSMAAGQVPTPPVQQDAQGGITPAPGLSPQQALQDADAQTTAMANQAKPEPPIAKSPLGRESPIEQADAGGKLRAGQKHHLRSLGLSQSGMDPISAKNYEKTAVRDLDQYGEYDGMDDPHSPPPPVRVGKHSYNPKTGKFVSPEGYVSALDRIAPISGPQGPPGIRRQ